VKTSHGSGRTVSYVTNRGRHVGNYSYRFFAKRKGSDGSDRVHAAMDLYAREGDPVVACEDGEIVAYYHFHRGTYCIIVQNTSGEVINYGEVAADSLKLAGFPVDRVGRVDVYLTKADRQANKVWKTVPRYKLVNGGDYHVKAGQQIGVIGKMKKGSMLHFEMYTSGTTKNAQVRSAGSPPSNILDPTKYLLHLAENGL
jgi:murein DD-endopeptidase MepM/ murein hydrolase activator NlpD